MSQHSMGLGGGRPTTQPAGEHPSSQTPAPGLREPAPSEPISRQPPTIYADHVTAPQASAPMRPGTAPALNPVRWSGKKTAIAAALALGLGGVTAGAAAAINPSHETVNQRGPGGHGGTMRPGSMHGPARQAPQGNQNNQGPQAGLPQPGAGDDASAGGQVRPGGG